MSPTLPEMRTDWALFLDVDGTLLDFAITPEAVEVPPDLIDNLGALRRILGGALALVSGRSIAALDRLFAPLRLPAAGQHGAELRNEVGSEMTGVAPPRHLAAVIARLRDFAANHPGIVVEDKGVSVAVHYRQVPRYRGAVEAAARAAIGTDSTEMEMIPAAMAFDIKPRSADKGQALAWFMRRPPFAGRLPVFIGDDRTDEDGFAAVAAHGREGRAGHAIQVGNRPRAARWHIPAPADLRRWLRDCVMEHASP